MPRLTVAGGQLNGRAFDVPPGRTTIGRTPAAEITIDDSTVSRAHAELVRSGLQVVLTDLGSTNGTRVNDQPLDGSRELRDGDVVRLGSVELRFAAAHGQSYGSTSYSFGGVQGSVQTGSGTQYAAGRDQYVAGEDQYVAGRDIHASEYNISDGYDPSDEIFQGRGIGRLLAVIGSLIALVGFGMWMYLILGAAAGAGDGRIPENPFEREIIDGVPWPLAAFGIFALGGVLAGIGTGMSKAARRREEQRRRRRW
ncbi:MAG TPA: FHA domain-containing protein [Jiangellaceae bacterium]